jgi:hypothetical protein
VRVRDREIRKGREERWEGDREKGERREGDREKGGRREGEEDN